MLEPSKITFRSMQESDLPLMFKWLQTDFVVQWYGGKSLTKQEISEKYLPRIRMETYIKPFAILYDDIPIGYIQTYLIEATPDDYRNVINLPNSAGIDLFIGEVNYIHKGLGQHILRNFMKTVVFPQMSVKWCIIAPEPANKSAIRVYEKAGFRHTKTVAFSDGNQEYVMVHTYDWLMQAERIRVRASLAVVQDEKILLVPHYYPNRPVEWFLPGGGVDYGETLKAAAEREFFEETGFIANTDTFLHLAEAIEPDMPYHGLGITFIGYIVSGVLKREPHPIFGDKTPRWFAAGDLQDIIYKPQEAIEKALNMNEAE